MKKVYGRNILPEKNKMSKNKMYIVITCVIIVLVILFVSGQIFKGKSGESNDDPTYQVKRGPLTISFVESGTIKARDQIIIKNEVEGRTSIISLIPEGTRVKKGDLLVELDASSLEDEKIDQEIRVQNAEASYIGSKENLAVVENKAESDKDLAKLTFEFAKLDLKKYTDPNGEYENQLREAQSEITLANEELTRAEKERDSSRKLFKEKYISQTEQQEYELAFKKWNLKLQLAQSNLALLKNFTYKRNLAQLESDVSQAAMALERTTRKATADVVQAQADLKAKEAEYLRQKDKLQKSEDQIKKTEIYAPADGLVIYATSASASRRGNVEPLDEGREVREREDLIYLPVGNLSKAEIAIHESNLEKAQIGLPAIITVDALGNTFYGKVAKIAPLPDAQSMWMNPDLKVYNADIYIDGNNEILRTGKSCQVEIIIQQYQDVVYVPLQAVLRVGTEPTVYVQAGDSFEPRKVKTGLDNNKMIHILEGLDEEDVVLLSPPLKSAAISSENHNDLRGQSSAEQLQQKISERLNNIKTDQTDKTSDRPGDGTSDTKERKRRSENLDPEKREEMRKRFQQMSPEEKEKIRKERQK
jgi:HlyD family secretion protein